MPQYECLSCAGLTGVKFKTSARVHICAVLNKKYAIGNRKEGLYKNVKAFLMAGRLLSIIINVVGAIRGSSYRKVGRKMVI